MHLSPKMWNYVYHCHLSSIKFSFTSINNIFYQRKSLPSVRRARDVSCSSCNGSICHALCVKPLQFLRSTQLVVVGPFWGCVIHHLATIFYRPVIKRLIIITQWTHIVQHDTVHGVQNQHHNLRLESDEFILGDFFLNHCLNW